MIKLQALLICLVLVGCKNQQKVAETTKVKDFVTIYESACEGACPVYSMTIYTDGSATFLGKEHTKILGEQTYSFPKENLVMLFENLNALNFETFEEGESFIVDIPETKLEYHNNTIIVKDLRTLPEDFSKVLLALKKLTRSTGFVN
jgi:hypothetical protein